jgi:exodeoxyribonuclease-3
MRALLAADIAGIRVINVYVPNGQVVGADKYQFKLKWMKRLREFLDQAAIQNQRCFCAVTLMWRPKNATSIIRCSGKTEFSSASRKKLRFSTSKTGDSRTPFVCTLKQADTISWWDYRAGGFRRNLGLRIDHVWVSEPLAKRSTKTWIDKETRAWERPSDHAPVVAEFE